MTTSANLIQKAERGERVTKDEAGLSTYPAAVGSCAVHDWRVIVCDESKDLVECRKCGAQAVFVCNFDDDMS